MRGLEVFGATMIDGIEAPLFILITLWVILQPVLFVAAVVLIIRDIVKKKFNRSTQIVIVSLIAVVIIKMLISQSA